MYNMDPITLTNQPKTDINPSLILSRVVGCWGVVVLEAEPDQYQMAVAEADELEVFWFGRVGDAGASFSTVLKFGLAD